MVPNVSRFPLDLTGQSRNNFIPNELRKLKHLPVRSIVPYNALFYGKSVRILDNITQQYLIPEVQFKVTGLHPEATRRSGKGVYGLIVIDDVDVNDSLTLSYQTVGGEYLNNFNTISQLLNVLENDTRSTLYGNLEDVPNTVPPVHHLHDIGDVYNFDEQTHVLERLRAALALRDTMTHDYLFQYTDAKVSNLLTNGAQLVDTAMYGHDHAADAHPQYLTRAEAMANLQLIRKPVNVTPSAGQTNVALDVTLVTAPYYSVYRTPQQSVQFQVSRNQDFSGTLEIDQTVIGTATSYHYPSVLTTTQPYYWRSRFTDINGFVSAWSDPTQFSTGAVLVVPPTVSSPTDAGTVSTESFTINATAFAISGGSDTHQSTDWEIWTGPNGTGSRVWSSLNNTTNKTAITVPIGVLTRNSTYYPRVRYRGATYGLSAWSAVSSFYITWQLRPTVIGQSFGGGYWAGDIVIGPDTFAIIVAPKASGETTRAFLTPGVSTPGAYSDVDSVANTATLLSYSSQAAQYVRGLNISTYTDWQLPASTVLQIVLQNLGPSDSAPVLFRPGGAEVMSVADYWSSTAYDWVRDDSYTAGGDPIYGQVYHEKLTQVDYTDIQSSGTVSASPDDFYIGTCEVREGHEGAQGSDFAYFSHDNFPGTDNPWRYANFVTFSCSYSYVRDESYYTTEIVGYTPIEDFPVYTNLYQAYSQRYGNARNNEDKVSARLVRAVRLVKVA